MKYLAQITALLFFTSCSLGQGDHIHELVNGKNKWLEQLKKRDYSFMYKRQCFCALRDKEILVKVQNGKIISTITKDGEEVNSKHLLTMKQLFDSILENIKRQEWEKNLTINVEYHPTLGYPSSIVIKRFVMDGNRSESISNVEFYEHGKI